MEINALYLMCVAADRFRGDLEAAGIGDGRHGFVLDAALSPLTHHAIEVRFANGGALENAPILLAPAPAFDDALEKAVAAAVDAALDDADGQARVLDFLAAQREQLLQRRADADARRAWAESGRRKAAS